MTAGQIRHQTETARRARSDVVLYLQELDRQFQATVERIWERWRDAKLQEMAELDREAHAIEKERRFYKSRLKEINAAVKYIDERSGHEQAA